MATQQRTDVDTQYLFLDTNIYLHAQFFDQIPWSKLAHVERAVIVLPYITVRELDQKKYTGRTKRIRARAQAVTARFLEVLQSDGQFAERASLREYFEPPNVDMAAAELDPGDNDDRLLAAILSYRVDQPDHAVVLVSSDAGPLLKARRLKIPALSVPEQYMLDPELDESEKELRKAKSTLAQIQAAQPNLSVTFVDGAKRLQLNKPQAMPSDAELERSIREHHGKWSLANFDPQARIADILGTLAVDPRDVERYRRELPSFLENWAEWWRVEVQRQVFASQVLRIALVVRNAGSRPATDARIQLRFPPWIGILKDLEMLAPIREPEPPIEPRSTTELFAESILSTVRTQASYGDLFADPEIPEFRTPDPWEPTIETDDDGTRVTHFVDKVSQDGAPVVLNAVHAYVPDLASFNVEYQIICDELHRPETGHLHFVASTEE